MSVHQIIAEMRQEHHDPVLVYKPQGDSLPDHPTIPESSFIAAFQTEFRQGLYREFGSTILCIDSTHKTTAYGFKLITLLVADEYHEGEPNQNYINPFMVHVTSCLKGNQLPGWSVIEKILMSSRSSSMQ